MAKAKTSKSSSKKASTKKAKKGKKSQAVVPKSLRRGVLPTSAGEVLAAGLGALRDAQTIGSKQFDELVKRGRAVQASGSEAARKAVREVDGAVDRVMDTVRSAGENAVDGVQGRVESAVESVLGRLGVPTSDEIRDLQAIVDALTARVTSTLDTSLAPTKWSVFEVKKHEDGWSVRRVGAERAASVRSTKKEALHEARTLARRHAPSRLTVYKLDGSVSGTTEYEA